MAQKLYEFLDLQYLERTGSLFPGRSLRFKSVRALFGWTQSLRAHRFFTYGALRLALQILVRDYEISLPLLGHFDANSWLNDQSKILHRLCKRAVKNAWERGHSKRAVTAFPC